MMQSFQRTVLATLIVLFGLIGSVRQSASEDIYHETRRHWSMSDIADRLPPDKRESLLKAMQVPKVTVITRNWIWPTRKEKTLDKKSTVRTQTIVLFDPVIDGILFSWSTDRDWDGAKSKCKLVIWYPGGSRDEIVVDVQWLPLGHDLESYLIEARKARSQGKLADDEQLPVTLDYGGRKLTLSMNQWRKGLLTQEQKTWLDSVKSERLKNALNVIMAVARGFTELVSACDFVVLPFLGIYDKSFEPSIGKLVRPRGKPDCDFDAQFGEPCSLKDQLEFVNRKQPQLSPPKE